MFVTHLNVSHTPQCLSHYPLLWDRGTGTRTRGAERPEVLVLKKARRRWSLIALFSLVALSLWVLFKCSLSSFCVLYESSWSHPEVILKSSWRIWWKMSAPEHFVPDRQTDRVTPCAPVGAKKLTVIFVDNDFCNFDRFLHQSCHFRFRWDIMVTNPNLR